MNTTRPDSPDGPGTPQGTQGSRGSDRALAALSISRICHDLANPIGAIANGLELVTLAAQGSPELTPELTPELALLRDSASTAGVRLRFFRIAFGEASADQSIARTQVESILAEMSRLGSVRYDWHSPAVLPRSHVRAAFLGVLCVQMALAFGGRTHTILGAQEWVIEGEAPRLRPLPQLWSALQNPAAPFAFDAASVQFALLPRALASVGRGVRCEASAMRVRLAFPLLAQG
ncbi:MAG: histidine phosphotransferase [Rhodobacteraceae bacterium]|nr:histidine phosphotransferase [Paracoccaceae bacterium]